MIADNLSAHKSQTVKDFLAAHPKVHLHVTPTYSSWLNQVELWFAKIERDVIARLAALKLRIVLPGTFEQLAALQRKQATGTNANQVKVPTLLRNPEQKGLLQRGTQS